MNIVNCNVVPKVELHCHLDGIVSPAILREAMKRGYDLPIPVDALDTLYPVEDFNDFINWFRVSNPYFEKLEDYEPVLVIYADSLKTQNVLYSEIMIPSGEIPRDRGEMMEKVGTFREYVNSLEEDEIQIELLIAFGRNRSPNVVEEIAERVLTLYDADLICGVALAGPEVDNPVKPFRRTFERFREAGIGIEIHAGEWCGPESVWDALENGFPDRIGHGVAIFEDPHLVERVKEGGTHIEMCPTSNLKTGSVSSIERHPIKLALDLGVNFSINTDDPGIFQCTLESEFKLLEETFGFRREDFSKIMANSLRSRFQEKLRYAALNQVPTN